MKMEDLVPNLETCKRMREVGFRQNSETSAWVWILTDSPVLFLMDFRMWDDIGGIFICIAPTLAEILEEIKKFDNWYVSLNLFVSGMSAVKKKQSDFPYEKNSLSIQDDNLTQAAAELWIKLKEMENGGN